MRKKKLDWFINFEKQQIFIVFAIQIKVQYAKYYFRPFRKFLHLQVNFTKIKT